ncbi:ATP-binding cassette domain-containing protein [Streptomyces sp. NPDC090057]|uniref:ATP-binding cassette domain-containing protein n=1 Tax=Streptomyces sp. NPDC090057 TaxID=3365935 RepID=UPI0037F3CAA6
MGVRRQALRFLRARWRVLVRLGCWSALEAGQTFVLGYALARALDAGFLAGNTRTGLLWLSAAGLAVAVGAYGTGRVYGAVAALVEPARDRLVERVVARGVREADGGALSGLTQQVEIARDTSAGLVLVSRSFLFTAAGALAGLCALDPLLLAVVVPPLLAGVALFAATLRPLARRQESFLAADEALAGELGAVCPGLRDVAAAGAEARMAAETSEAVAAEERAARALARWSVARVAALAVGGELPVVLLLVAAPWLLGHGVSAGALVGALAYVTQSLLPALQNLVHGLGTSGSRLTVVLRRLLPPTPPDVENRPPAARRPADGPDRQPASGPLGRSDRHPAPGSSTPHQHPAPDPADQPDPHPAPDPADRSDQRQASASGTPNQPAPTKRPPAGAERPDQHRATEPAPWPGAHPAPDPADGSDQRQASASGTPNQHPAPDPANQPDPRPVPTPGDRSDQRQASASGTPNQPAPTKRPPAGAGHPDQHPATEPAPRPGPHPAPDPADQPDPHPAPTPADRSDQRQASASSTPNQPAPTKRPPAGAERPDQHPATEPAPRPDRHPASDPADRSDRLDAAGEGPPARETTRGKGRPGGRPPRPPAPRLGASGGGPAPRREPGGAVRPRPRPRPGAPALSLRGVTFAYGPASEPVLDGLDLRLPAGGHLAVVGPSGIGKSTLTGLVAGLLKAREGVIRVYGHTVPSPEAAAARVLIPQEAYVHGGTLAENLGMFRRETVPEAELTAAAEAVGCLPLLEALGGPAAVVDPAALSAGERQLIALTRAYLSPAPLALLDEATCHLDAAAEARAERAFAARPGGTLVVVAHRISSALRAGRVLVLDGPRTACGTHEELLRTSARYRDLVGGWTAEPAAPVR